jgi:hypothetical protein
MGERPGTLVQLHAGFGGAGTGAGPPDITNADGEGRLWFPTTMIMKGESAMSCVTTSKHATWTTVRLGEEL